MPTRDLLIDDWRPGEASAPATAADLDALSEILHAIVHIGAGVSFVVPYSLDDARGFWRDRVLPGVHAGTKRVLVAREDGRIVGTVQLELGMPPNQRHRAEVNKMLVHPDRQRRGIARAADGGARAGGPRRGPHAAHARHLDRQPRRAALSIARVT